MRLQNLRYSEFQGRPKEWQIVNCTFDDINLIVGKNATGKTRTLKVVKALADLLAEHRRLVFINGDYDVVFSNSGKTVSYTLKYENRKVIKEQMIVDNELYLERDATGQARIFTVETNSLLKFQVSDDEVAAFVRTDPIQHPFLDDLHRWGRNLRYFLFGSSLGQNTLRIADETAPDKNLDLRMTEQVIDVFIRGNTDFPDQFSKLIKQDMAALGYEIEKIGTDLPGGFVLPPALPLLSTGIMYVKEADLKGKTFQHEMSQGMFRALSVIIQLNYSYLANIPSFILIDDIGEGLDFERSAAFVQLMIEKAKQSGVQLIMTTNDRFIMNKVSLEYWIVLQRQGGKSIHHNYRNSKEIFDQFKFTGLTNFDLFSSNYYLKDKPDP